MTLVFLIIFRYYDEIFSALGRKCGQVLLTLENVARRNQYLNVRNTFRELFNFGVMPIVNENDTVATEQIRFGDNDTLASQVRFIFDKICFHRSVVGFTFY